MMWSETSSSSNTASQQVPMTGLLAKRKRDEVEDLLPVAKLGPRLQRWQPTCGTESSSSPRSHAHVPLWPPEDDSPPESDDEEEDDDGLLLLQPVEPRAAKPPVAYNRYPYPEIKPPYFTEPCVTDVAPPSYYRPPAEPYCPPPRFNRPTQQQQQQYWPSSQQYCYPGEAPTPPPQPVSSVNQTIRCAENGKSYLELGSSPATTSSAKCSSRASSYRQQRLAVLNISMCKLSRFRQFPDPSLHRSVLICNTLRRIEREMEHDSQFFCSEPPPSASTPTPAINYPSVPNYPATPPPQDLAHYEHSLRDLASTAPRATPFPSPAHPSTDSDSAGSINWGSVLSLSSQSDLDPLNNNGSNSSSLLDEFDTELLPSWRLSGDDVLKSVPANMESSRGGDELVDSLMHVLVGT